jgi:hypothetical protein
MNGIKQFGRLTIFVTEPLESGLMERQVSRVAGAAVAPQVRGTDTNFVLAFAIADNRSRSGKTWKIKMQLPQGANHCGQRRTVVGAVEQLALSAHRNSIT